MAMSPASPPTVASRMTWWTLCTVTWICTSCHSSPWFPDFCHTYRKGRRLIPFAQWGCGDLCNTAVWGRNCVACSQYAHHLCYFAISISQLCKQEKLNISQSNLNPWGVNVSRLHRHWYKIYDCICGVPLFCSWGELFAGASEGSPLLPQTCGAKMWSSIRHHQQMAAAGTSSGPYVLSHLVKNFWCTDIYLQNKHINMLFVWGVFLVGGGG